MTSLLLPLSAPAALAVAAAAAFLSQGLRPRAALFMAAAASVVAVGSSFATAAMIAMQGPITAEIARVQGQVFGLRLGAVSVTMLCLVSFIGLVVVRYAATYLDGEARQGAFTGWLCLTLAAVLVLVLSGNLVQLVAAWIATSLFLHRLLLFYADRPGARRAARSKYIMARVGDVSLAGAALLMLIAFGTGDIATISDLARAGQGGAWAVGAAALLAVAACLKSAQFPTHGWLIEVVETPTPVSALLHAGVINAGGFLLIRFADVMLSAPNVLAVLAIVGGLSALLGGLIMLTQSAVKTSLAWSTVSQMGFMMLECGLGLFSLALLHIVAHSLYKAHSFLASGGAVERVTAIRRPGPIAVPNAGAVGRAFLVALALYVVVGLAFGFAEKPPQTLALGAILIFGIAYLFAQGFADTAPRALTRRTTIYALTASITYFTLQSLVTHLTAGVLPPPPTPGPLEWALITVTVISFAVVAVAQALFPIWANHPAAAGLRAHLANGLYAQAIFDRLLAGWSLNPKR